MAATMDRARITSVVLQSIRTLNLSREPADQLPEAVDAPLFGTGSPLDSLGLVSLLIEVEEMLQEQGFDVALSDERAMSQTRSPFRTVASLIAYIEASIAESS